MKKFQLFFIFLCINYVLSVKNILYIVIDDLRPEIGAYGIKNAHTPNIDRLAAKGMTYHRAYANFAMCGPTRNSFMTGRRPDVLRVYNLINHFREDFPSLVTLPGWFKQHDYLTLGVGKLFHPQLPPLADSEKSWSEEALPYENPFYTQGVPAFPCPIAIEKRDVTYIGLDSYCETEALHDTRTAERAEELLETAAKADKPFFLGVGFHEPHLPWQAESKYFDLHPLENITLPKYPYPPKNMPDIAWHYFSGPNQTRNAMHIVQPPAVVKNARRAYKSAVSEMDAKLGRVLDKLEKLGLENDTAILLHSDHGWQLGEHNEFRKNTNFELGTNIPFIISVPWLPASHGQHSWNFAELVDVYPTLADLANIPVDTTQTMVDGTSLVPTLSGTSVKEYAISQYPRRPKKDHLLWYKNDINHVARENMTYMGYTIRTKEWRYTEWYAWNQTSLLPIYDNVVGVELYDHRFDVDTMVDFDGSENENVVGDDAHTSLVVSLSSQLRTFIQQFQTPYEPKSNVY